MKNNMIHVPWDVEGDEMGVICLDAARRIFCLALGGL